MEKKSSIVIEPLDYDNPDKYYKHPMVEKSGAGLNLRGDSGFVSTLASFVSKLGKHVLTGNFDITTLNPPSSVMYPRPLLELYLENYQNACHYFKHAALNVEDPIEK